MHHKSFLHTLLMECSVTAIAVSSEPSAEILHSGMGARANGSPGPALTAARG